MVLVDVSFRGKIDAEDLKDDTCAKGRIAEGSIVKLLWIG